MAKLEKLTLSFSSFEQHVEPVPAVPPFSMALIDGNDFIVRRSHSFIFSAFLSGLTDTPLPQFTPDFLRDGFQGGQSKRLPHFPLLRASTDQSCSTILF